VEATAVAEDLPLPILYEDADLVVIDKPAGMVVHPARTTRRHGRERAAAPRRGSERRRRRAAAGIVHRLDRGTSGVMIAAKNDAAHQELARQFHDREVEKEYIALVWGLVQQGGASTRRSDAIRRPPEDVDTRAPRAQRRDPRHEAEHLRGVSLLHVAIATGRTHQIRVHLSAIGHPIVGDPTYGGVHRRVAHDVRAVQRLGRPFPHAARLAFTHPSDGRRLEFTSPLPGDLQSVLDDIRARQEEGTDQEP
jgi:23S rRNA pseudouridine1911/1915/1917 synthase